MNRAVFSLVAVLLAGCAPTFDVGYWSSSIEKDADNLTGELSGDFYSWGPSSATTFSGDEVRASLGYFCYQSERDGLALRLSFFLPELLEDEVENARMAVDGNLIDWDFDFFFTDSTAVLLFGSPLASVPSPSSVDVELLGRDAYAGWNEYGDSVLALLADADSIAFDLDGRVVRFSAENISRSIEAVRSWCAVDEVIESRNEIRENLLEEAQVLFEARERADLRMDLEDVRRDVNNAIRNLRNTNETLRSVAETQRREIEIRERLEREREATIANRYRESVNNAAVAITHESAEFVREAMPVISTWDAKLSFFALSDFYGISVDTKAGILDLCYRDFPYDEFGISVDTMNRIHLGCGSMKAKAARRL